MNGIPSKCDANYDEYNETSCQYNWMESLTPTVDGLSLGSTRKKRSSSDGISTITVAAGDQISLFGEDIRSLYGYCVCYLMWLLRLLLLLKWQTRISLPVGSNQRL